MNRLLIVVAAIVVIAGGGFFALAWRPAIAEIEGGAAAMSFLADDVERGRVLAGAGNCASCHGADLAGGRGIASDFGTIYATNITPDTEHGIGTWSFEAFSRAMKSGVRRDGAHLFPAFPYTHYAKLTDADVNGLYAYVMSQQPVATDTPATKLDGIYNWRALQGGWKLLNFKGGAFSSDSDQTEAWNRGAYLAEGLGHCSACHSPRNAIGGELTGDRAYAGAVVDNWYAPALNAAPDARLPWTASELYAFLRQGGSPLHGSAAGTMAEVVHDGLALLPDSDIEALAAYFADLGGAPAEIASADVAAAMSVADDVALDADQARGELIFVNYCVSCHLNREGAPSALRPELALNSAVVGPDPSTFIRIVLDGVSAADGHPDADMPGFRYILSERDVADVAAYVRAVYAPGGGGDWGDVEARAREISMAGGAGGG
jgi:mono/diheme cytochrome c family protein